MSKQATTERHSSMNAKQCKATRRKVAKRAAKLGCEFIINAEPPHLDCEVIAPVGMVFADDDLHCLVGSQDDWTTPEQIYDDLIFRMAGGVKPCPFVDCDFCHQEKTS